MNSSELKIHAPQGGTLRVLRCLSDKPKSLRDIQRETGMTYFQIPGIASALLDFGLAQRAGVHGRDWTATPLGLEIIAQDPMVEFQIPGAAWDFYSASNLGWGGVCTVVRRVTQGSGSSVRLNASRSNAEWLARRMGCDGKVQSGSSGTESQYRRTGQVLLTAQQRILDALKEDR